MRDEDDFLGGGEEGVQETVEEGEFGGGGDGGFGEG